MDQIVEKIIALLQQPGSHYFNLVDADGDTLKIRVSDHSANRQNNGDRRTLSFISKRTPAKTMGWGMAAEWLVIDNDMTDTYEYIGDILADNGILITALN